VVLCFTKPTFLYAPSQAVQRRKPVQQGLNRVWKDYNYF